MEEFYGIEDASDILPMWIADMDFAAPEAVIDAMKEVLDHGVFGYSYICDECKDAIRYGLLNDTVGKRKMNGCYFTTGLFQRLLSVIETFTENGDGILITPPVYPPFFQVPERLERTIVECVMIEKDRNYSIDFAEFEKVFQQNVKLFILCNPHNPGGIVWTEAELTRNYCDFVQNMMS